MEKRRKIGVDLQGLTALDIGAQTFEAIAFLVAHRNHPAIRRYRDPNVE